VSDRDLDGARDRFDRSDLSDAIDSATWETDVDPDPMIVTSIRLPKSLLDWVREQGAAEQLKPTALIRRWIEDKRRVSAARPTSTEDDSMARLAERISRLEAVTLRVVAVERDTADESMTELLAALQRSVDESKRESAPRSSDEDRRGA
jgi:non-homologous end joining protein Ku